MALTIIVEGPDASGKTSLCEVLSQVLNYPVVHTGGPNHDYRGMITKCDHQSNLARGNMVILDRITPISELIYRNIFNMLDGPKIIMDTTMLLKKYRDDILQMPGVVVIFCRPPNEILMDHDRHEWKDHDTDEHIEKVVENMHLYIERYDAMMSDLPCIHYDWTKDSLSEDKLVDIIVEMEKDFSEAAV